MSETTPRLRLAQLVSLQECTTITWNEALAQLDALVDLRLLGQYINAPPASPADGDAYLVGGAPTGAWSGYAYKIASCLDGAWRFYQPYDGLRAYVTTSGTVIVYRAGSWTAIGSADFATRSGSEALSNKTLSACAVSDALVLAGGQIAFPAAQNPSSSANALDDYEEGSWTPTLIAATTPPTGQSVALVNGDYVKIGRFVYLFFELGSITAGTGGTGAIQIGGLPFALGDVVSYVGGTALATRIAMNSGYTMLQLNMPPSTGRIQLIQNGSNISGIAVDYANIGTNATIRGFIAYLATQ